MLKNWNSFVPDKNWWLKNGHIYVDNKEGVCLYCNLVADEPNGLHGLVPVAEEILLEATPIEKILWNMSSYLNYYDHVLYKRLEELNTAHEEHIELVRKSVKAQEEVIKLMQRAEKRELAAKNK